MEKYITDFLMSHHLIQNIKEAYLLKIGIITFFIVIITVVFLTKLFENSTIIKIENNISVGESLLFLHKGNIIGFENFCILVFVSLDFSLLFLLLKDLLLLSSKETIVFFILLIIGLIFLLIRLISFFPMLIVTNKRLIYRSLFKINTFINIPLNMIESIDYKFGRAKKVFLVIKQQEGESLWIKDSSNLDKFKRKIENLIFSQEVIERKREKEEQESKKAVKIIIIAYFLLLINFIVPVFFHPKLINTPYLYIILCLFCLAFISVFRSIPKHK